MDDQDQTNDEIVDGEVVAADIPTQTADASGAMVLESLESLIRENLLNIDKLGQELNKHKEMIDSVLANDETYKQHDEAAKAAAKAPKAKAPAKKGVAKPVKNSPKKK